MKIIINSESLITGYTVNGDLENSIDVPVPEEFLTNFKPGYYRLKDNVVLLNENYTPPVFDNDNYHPTEMQQSITALAKSVGDLSAQVSNIKQIITKQAKQGDE
ncbi:DUF2977 domain-containing protein [Leuconostoc mesenteroides]|uniref:DUF2977 domain-containing protein n=1 Tax=Leuconostoc mesenteroides TaxID=1245 RepID=UPI0035258FB4